MIFAAILFLGFIFNNDASLQEHEVVKKVLERESGARLVRPVENYNDAINVSIGLSLLDIVNFDEDKQIVTVKLWFSKFWNSATARWTEEGIDDIRVMPYQMWVPDVMFYNGLSSHFADTPTMVVVTRHGDCAWIPPITNKFRCRLHHDSFNCTMKLGSWTYDGSQFNLTNYDLDLSYFVERDWEIHHSGVTRHVKTYECCPEPYIDIEYFFTIRKVI